MFVLTLDGDDSGGAYAVKNDQDRYVLYLFQGQDDAARYAMMLEDMGFPEIRLVQIEDSIILKACEMQNYTYTIITLDDLVIPKPDIDYDFI